MFLKDLKEFNLSKTEEKVLEYWKKNKIFEKSLENRRTSDVRRKKDEFYSAKAAKGRKNFVFFEGPPTANAKPGLHHVLARAFKDVVLRYKTMRGYYAPRRAGWDTHGLPVEIQVEKELGLKSKKDIEKYGIAEFNKKCRESVWKHKDEWERLTERMGFWLDMKNPYVTYEKDYIETLWWIIAQFWKKKLLYKGNRIVNWCPRCGTGLSSHEMALGYKEVEDNSVYVKFKLNRQSAKRLTLGDRVVYILSWTTTPWTLPGNVALAVGKDIGYTMILLRKTSEVLIVATELVTKIFGELLGSEAQLYGKVLKGSDLVGLQYEPLFDVKPFKGNPSTGSGQTSYRVCAADFVTTENGTGVVHTAVMYGEDDYKLGVKVGLPQHHTVDESGKFTKDVKGFQGLYVMAPETEKKIFKHLEDNGNLLKIEKYTHEYPHCWRCETPLLYYARQSWFVAMAKLKKGLLKNNETINWIPEHIKTGRFGEWLLDVKDWNFSRERYWGTPLPLWHCEKCDRYEEVGGLGELNQKSFGSENEYWVMRHGESEANMLRIIDAGSGKYHLTEKGKIQVGRAAEKLRRAGIDLIIASPVLRAKETEKITAKTLGVKKIIFDDRLREIKISILKGKSNKEYHRRFPTYESRFAGGPGAESLREVRTRVWNFFQDLEKKYKDKRILLISHEYPIWMIAQVANGWTEAEAIREKEKRGDDFAKTGELIQLDFKVAPRDETGEVNLHRPYIDDVELQCSKCKGVTKRIKELCDVWFDSGAMPFAQVHYPFSCAKNSKHEIRNSKQCINFPAEYIAEAVDQTRGWFYTLLAVATALGLEAPYKNVISLGHINDKHGQKMSKSKGNVVDPWQMTEKYGIDAVRWYFYAASPPGEPRNFDEQEILKTYRRLHLILWNSLVFYLTYADKKIGVRGSKFESKKSNSNISNKSISLNILDQWILARLDETIKKTTKHFDAYQIREAALEIEKLIDDLSRWYIRRSRRRLSAVAKGFGGQAETRKDYEDCSRTLGYVLGEISKMTAPFNPFFAEILWNALDGKNSVHLENWPEVRSRIEDRGSKLLKSMAEVRRLAALGLAKRAEAGIKVRQPLATLKIKNEKSKIKISKELLEILAEEVNVKGVVFSSGGGSASGGDPKLKGEVELDTKITVELKEEGVIRELSRAVQELRQKANLRSSDVIVLMLEVSEGLRQVIQKNESMLKKEVGAKTIDYKKSEKFRVESEMKVEGESVWVGLRRV